MKSPGSQFQQLSMLMPAKDIVRRLGPSADVEFGDKGVPGMLNRKLEESKAPGFRSPGEVINGYRIPTGQYPKNNAHGAGVYDSLQSKGYDGKPLSLHHDNYDEPDSSPDSALSLRDGNHRLAAANDLNMEVPVVHHSPEALQVRQNAKNESVAPKDVRIGSEQRASKKPGNK